MRVARTILRRRNGNYRERVLVVHDRRENYLSYPFTMFNTTQLIGRYHALVMNAWCLDVLRTSCTTGFARLTAYMLDLG